MTVPVPAAVEGAISVSIGRELVDLAASIFEARHPNMLWSGRFARDHNQPVRIENSRRSFRINDFWRHSRPGAG